MSNTMARIFVSTRLAVLVAVVAALVTAVLAGNANAGTAIGAKGLEARLLAPCCYGGTLDVHDSELAHDLRKEIEDRIARGESADVIEADFVTRFGPRVRALPTEGALTTSFLVVFAAIIAAAGILFWRIRARARAASLAQPDPSRLEARDAFDDELDEELADRDY
ncbi:MAG: cytochrome c-type biogenesis protein CcmH [Polyangiaceae bacterium]|jgi:cytochrome c-type biogenesis protein CcmH